MYGFTEEDLNEFGLTQEDLTGDISRLTRARIARGLLVRILREEGRDREIDALPPLRTRDAVANGLTRSLSARPASASSAENRRCRLAAVVLTSLAGVAAVVMFTERVRHTLSRVEQKQ